jgi:glycerol dehydrogenase-like iron-containing ADH family enzyme
MFSAMQNGIYILATRSQELIHSTFATTGLPMFAVQSPAGYDHQPGLRHQIGEVVSTLDNRIAILTSRNAWRVTGEDIQASLSASKVSSQLLFLDGECTEQAIADFQQQIAASGIRIIVGVGGGRVMDLTKATADAVSGGLAIMLPTIAATCAAWSPISILYNQQGGHQGTRTLNTLPHRVLVDSELILGSDIRYLKAGIIDALAKWYEFVPYQSTMPHDLALQMKMMAAGQVREMLDQHAEQALDDHQQQKLTPALCQTIDACIAGAGLANSMRSDAPFPGVAHAIHNQLTHIPELHHWLHGEKVGFGLLAQSYLENHATRFAQLHTDMKRYQLALALPFSQQRIAEMVEQIISRFRFPAAAKEALPFSLNSDALRQALQATIALLH